MPAHAHAPLLPSLNPARAARLLLVSGLLAMGAAQAADPVAVAAGPQVPVIAVGAQAVAGLVRRARAELGAPMSIGVGHPGAQTAAGRIKNANSTCLNGQLLQEDLQRRLTGRERGEDVGELCRQLALGCNELLRG